MVNYDDSLLAEATLKSFDASGFTLTWSTALASTVHYLALGGTDITAAYVKSWATTGTTGNQAITGVGFQPTVAIHIGVDDTTASPDTTGHMRYHIGAMDSAGNQWAKYGFAATSVTTSSTGRDQLTDSCIVGSGGSTTVNAKAAYVSMDSNGFTINWSIADAEARNYMSLCLTGCAAQVGSWNKTTSSAPSTDSITTAGMTVEGLLMVTDSHAASSTVVSGHRLSIGSVDNQGANQATLVSDKGGVTTTVANKFSSTDRSLLISDSDTQAFDTVGVIAALGPISTTGTVNAGEGICTDGTYYYTTTASGLYKYDLSWNLVASNANAGSQVGVNHLGGLDYFNDVLYIAACNATAGSNPTITNASIAIFDRTLNFLGYTDISAQFNGYRDPAGLTVDAQDWIVWVVSFWVPGVLVQYNLSDLSFSGTVTPSPAFTYPIQGIKYYNGTLYLSYCNTTSD
jgi:hypothetical protein